MKLNQIVFIDASPIYRGELLEHYKQRFHLTGNFLFARKFYLQKEMWKEFLD